MKLLAMLLLLLLACACQSTRNVTSIYVYDGFAEITCDAGGNSKPITADVARDATLPVGMP